MMKLGRLDEAQKVFQDAIDLAELMRMDLIDPEHRSAVASRYASLYKKYVDLDDWAGFVSQGDPL